jgi:hypothetical protein
MQIHIKFIKINLVYFEKSCEKRTTVLPKEKSLASLKPTIASYFLYTLYVLQVLTELTKVITN